MKIEERALKLETRRNIYQLILKHPGLHLREISRRVNLTFNNLRYHLDYLKKQGLIITETNQGYSRFYAKQKFSQKDKELFNLLRQEVPRKIILLLHSPGTGDIYKKEIYQKSVRKIEKNPTIYPRAFSKAEIFEITKYWKKKDAKPFQLKKHPTTLDFHLEKLLDADVIEKVKVGKEIKYRLKDCERIFNFCIIYNPELSNDAINLWLRWSKLLGPKNFDSILNIFYEICPHPYHI